MPDLVTGRPEVRKGRVMNPHHTEEMKPTDPPLQRSRLDRGVSAIREKSRDRVNEKGETLEPDDVGFRFLVNENE